MPTRFKILIAICLLVGAKNSFAQPLTSGQWSMLSVTADGVFRIDYNLLKTAGFNPDQIDPRAIQIFSNGTGMLPQANAAPRQNQLKEIPILVRGEADGKFDKSDDVLFFAQGPDEYHFNSDNHSISYENNLYSDKNFYFITVGSNPGKRLSSTASLPGSFPAITSYVDFGYYETEQFNVLTSGRQWFGEQFTSSSSLTIQFNVRGVVPNTDLILKSSVMGQSFASTSSFKVFFNEVQIMEQTIPKVPEGRYEVRGAVAVDSTTVKTDNINASTQAAQNIRYEFIKAQSGYSVGYIDNFIFTLTRKLAWYENQNIYIIPATDGGSSTLNVAGFPSGKMIWDITDPLNPSQQEFSASQSAATFSCSTASVKKFVAFDPAIAAAPLFEKAVPTQNLSALPPLALLIISHPDFATEATRLAAFRRSQNVTVQVVWPQEIYNEFSGGKQDVTAIRDFIRSLYVASDGTLQNVLIIGRGSYDYKNRVANNTNFVPVYESRNSLDPLATYASDDFYTFMEQGEGTWQESPVVNHTMDIGIGRIPAVTVQQAHDAVNKLIQYDSGPDRFGAWRNNLIFVADDGDDNQHQAQSNGLSMTVQYAHPELTIEKVFLDQYKQVTRPSGQYSPEAQDVLERTVSKGALIVNYTGHGSENVWMQEQVLNNDVVDLWKKNKVPSLFVTATCEFGRSDDPFELSNAENLLLHPGGAISLVSTSRPVYSFSNDYLNDAFYQQLFVRENNSYRDLGTVFRDTKNNSLSGVGNRNFSLIGDPSLHLAFPSLNAVITEIQTASGSDTLKALSRVAMKGEIQTNASKVSSFNGVATITIIDRPVSFLTKGDENLPFAYTQLSNILFRGDVSVKSGEFNAEFILPKTIASPIAEGKAIAYAHSNSTDASGSMKLSIGGVEPEPTPDNTGPEVRLFLGDTTFINGGIASPNTQLIADLSDNSGLNMSSPGAIGNMIAVLDDSLSFDLGPYFSTQRDDFTRGSASLPLFGLAPGRHTITVSGQDVYGNRSEGKVNFVITSGDLLVSSFYNYPNPFSEADHTTLGFTHNRPGEDLDVELVIVDMRGVLMVEDHYTITESQTTVTLAEWDGTTFAGNKLGTGVYVGKLSVRSLLDGSKNHHFTKLIIVN